LVPNPEERARAEFARAERECFAVFNNSDSPINYHTHRVAADRMRVRMIELLQASHKPPYERIPNTWGLSEDGEPARSPIFKDMETQFIQPIDSTAVKVAGSEPSEDK
jgi:hypothetical protein